MTEEEAVEIHPQRAAAGHGYRDGLNFTEFPVASVSDTIADNQKTLEFTDEIFDQSTGKTVTRTLAVTGADKFGLPTALDDEVLLGLMQLTCALGFADRKVHFSRYELIKLLGWRDESKSYRRVEESLNRWTGVTLQYQKAWWSKDEQCWVSETFHVIDQVTVFDRERIARRRKMVANGSPDMALSSFVWNETVFQSFKSGYIKSIDFDFYKCLESAIAKRMFRFLDKRFYHKGRWDFGLRSFACEKLGLSKNYSNSELKRKLLPAVRELEARGFLVPLAEGERFARVRQGDWTAVFVRAAPKVSVLALADGDTDALVGELVSRGITKRSAQKLVSHHVGARIREKIALFDSLRGRGGEGAIRNRAGWLYSAIVYDYSGPDVAKPPARLRVPINAQPRRTGVPLAPSPEQSPTPPGLSEFEAHWAGLSPDGQAAFEAEAVAAAPAFLQKQYRDGEAERGTLWRVTRRQVLAGHLAARTRETGR